MCLTYGPAQLENRNYKRDEDQERAYDLSCEAGQRLQPGRPEFRRGPYASYISILIELVERSGGGQTLANATVPPKLARLTL